MFSFFFSEINLPSVFYFHLHQYHLVLAAIITCLNYCNGLLICIYEFFVALLHSVFHTASVQHFTA